MAIKVQFPAGVESVIARGLFQWDYGQVLEIECLEIGTEIVEVHFACSNMSEAIVRSCAFTNSVGTVAIPDECLEQASPVNAWIYEVDGTKGRTIKTITLPITARIRPSNTRDIPSNYVDKYGQLIDEVNEVMETLKTGDVTVAKAQMAETAGHASTAGNASSATHAVQANKAGIADSVTAGLVTSVEITAGKGTTTSLTYKDIYLVIFDRSGTKISGVFCFGATISYAAIGVYSLRYMTDNTINLVDSEGKGYDGTLYFYKIGVIA